MIVNQNPLEFQSVIMVRKYSEQNRLKEIPFKAVDDIDNDLWFELYYNNRMEQTEKYLNSILSKRLGSVINQSAFSKNANTVTRIPRQEENVQSMPTVFRKKHETILKQQTSQPTNFRQTVKIQETSNNEEQKPMGSHRVEYMAISKRLMTKKQDDYISPTVDITKYSQKQAEKRQSSSNKAIDLQPISQEIGQQAQIKLSGGRQAVKPKRRKIFS